MWDRASFKVQVDVVDCNSAAVKVSDNTDVCFAISLGGPSKFSLNHSSVELAECGECVRFDYGSLVNDPVFGLIRKDEDGAMEDGSMQDLQPSLLYELSPRGYFGAGVRVTEGKVCVVSLMPLLGEKKPEKWWELFKRPFSKSSLSHHFFFGKIFG